MDLPYLEWGGGGQIETHPQKNITLTEMGKQYGPVSLLHLPKIYNAHFRPKTTNISHPPGSHTDHFVNPWSKNYRKSDPPPSHLKNLYWYLLRYLYLFIVWSYTRIECDGAIF